MSVLGKPSNNNKKNVTFVTLRVTLRLALLPKKKKFCLPREVKTLVKFFRIAKIGEKWLSAKYWGTPHFTLNIFFP